MICDARDRFDGRRNCNLCIDLLKCRKSTADVQSSVSDSNGGTKSCVIDDSSASYEEKWIGGGNEQNTELQPFSKQPSKRQSYCDNTYSVTMD